jgi:CRP-like cAMP-binding protein
LTKDSSTFVADPGLLKELEPRSRAVTLSPDRILFHQGDQPAGVYILHEGSVALSMHSGDEVTLRTVAGAGSLLGLPAVIGSKPYSLTAKARQGARLSFVRSDDFLQIMQAQPLIMFRVLQVLAQEIRAAREAFSDFVDASGVIS